MEITNLWSVPVGKINIANQFDMSAYADEVFNLYMMTNGEDDRQLVIKNKELFPIILDMRDNIITPIVKAFAKEHFNSDINDHYVDTNGKWIPEGEGLFPHYHPGSVISAICYPGSSNNAITMFDPRGNACRGYPRQMRNSAHFANFKFTPKAGDVLIFPSYVQHSVPNVDEATRLSLLHEYYVTTDL
jgi:hypothetical protein